MTVHPIPEEYIPEDFSSNFGNRTHPITGQIHNHNGVDIPVPVGTPVLSAKSGTVYRVGWENEQDHNQGYGQRIIVQNDDGSFSYYAHLSETSVSEGARINSGENIGLSGDTGASTGPHLHYGENLDGEWVDPTASLNEAETISFTPLSTEDLERLEQFGLNEEDGGRIILNLVNGTLIGYLICYKVMYISFEREVLKVA